MDEMASFFMNQPLRTTVLRLGGSASFCKVGEIVMRVAVARASTCIHTHMYASDFRFTMACAC
eukprot:11209750-Lingulodinium_polyedra.AAC.1